MVHILFLSLPRSEVLTVRSSDNDTDLPIVPADFFTNFRNITIDLWFPNDGFKKIGWSISRNNDNGSLPNRIEST